MSGGWAAKAPHISARAVARLPRFAEVVVCETEAAIWLQTKALSDDLERLLALIPGSRCFSVLPDNQLIPRGKLIPRGRLPEGPWQLLADWLDHSLAAPEIASSVSDCPAVAEHVRL